MNVKLKIRRHGKVVSELPLTPRRLHIITALSSDLVTAKLSLSNEEEGGEYALKISEPDIVARVEVDTGSEGNFVTYDNKEHREFPLFRGGLGGCELLLVKEVFEGEDLPQKLAIVYVGDKKKEQLYDIMVEGLFAKNLPHFVLNEFQGQMKKHRFTLEFNEGYASYDDDDIMLKSLHRLTVDLMPLLKCISQTPVMRYEKVSCRRPLSVLSRIDRETSRAIIRSQGSFEDLCARDERVRALRKRVTTRLPVHAAIKTFLEYFVLRRLVEIRIRCEKDVKQLKAKIKDMDAELKSKGVELKKKEEQIQQERNEGLIEKIKKIVGRITKRKNQKDDLETSIQSINEKLTLIAAGEGVVRGCLTMPIFTGISEDVLIYDLPPSDFMATEAYRRIYNIMAEFLRTRFWWIGDKIQSGQWRMPQRKLDGTSGTQQLQHKYSLVYENWSFAQMIFVLQNELGYKHIGDKILGVYGSCAFEKEDIVVRIVHDVITSSPKKGGTEFISKSGWTPDFALIVSHAKYGNVWYVMDAKSDGDLKPHMVDKMLKYANDESFRFLATPKSGVFLIRSGEDDGQNSEIEVPPPSLPKSIFDKLVQKPYEYKPEVINDWYSNDYTWIDGLGIVNNGRDIASYPYIGYVRVNAKFSRRAAVFKEFVDGLIKTAVRELQSKSQTVSSEA